MMYCVARSATCYVVPTIRRCSNSTARLVQANLEAVDSIVVKPIFARIFAVSKMK
jgi:hypothetical protein